MLIITPFILLSDEVPPLFNLNVIYDKINKLNTNLIHVVENNNENTITTIGFIIV